MLQHLETLQPYGWELGTRLEYLALDCRNLQLREVFGKTGPPTTYLWVPFGLLPTSLNKMEVQSFDTREHASCATTELLLRCQFFFNHAIFMKKQGSPEGSETVDTSPTHPTLWSRKWRHCSQAATTSPQRPERLGLILHGTWYMDSPTLQHLATSMYQDVTICNQGINHVAW